MQNNTPFSATQGQWDALPHTCYPSSTFFHTCINSITLFQVFWTAKRQKCYYLWLSVAFSYHKGQEETQIKIIKDGASGRRCSLHDWGVGQRTPAGQMPLAARIVKGLKCHSRPWKSVMTCTEWKAVIWNLYRFSLGCMTVTVSPCVFKTVWFDLLHKFSLIMFSLSLIVKCTLCCQCLHSSFNQLSYNENKTSSYI